MPLKSGFTVNGVKVAPDVPKIGSTSAAGAAGGTTLIDTALLTEANDYWNGAMVLILSGSNRGLMRTVADYDLATGTLTLEPALPAQVASGVQYLIYTGSAAGLAAWALGANNANNGFDSSNVAANRDGSVLERLEDIVAVLLATEPVQFTPSDAPSVDEDGGRAAVAVSIVDRNTGQVAAASIDITAITYELAKSTAGGAFSTVGITQPSGATKADGLVELQFDFLAAEWGVGDTYRLKVGDVTATVGGTVYHMGTLTWVGEVVEDFDVKTTVDDIDTDLGEPSDVGVDPDGGAGTLHAKVAGLGTRVGDVTDAAVEPDGGAGSLHAKVAGVGQDVNTLRDVATTVAPIADSVEDELDRILAGAGGAKTGTADAGSTSALLVDAALTEANDYWNGALLVMRTGANAGLARPVVDFTAATDTANVAPAFPSAIGIGDTYVILPRHALLETLLALSATGVSVTADSLADQLYIAAGAPLRTFVAKPGGTDVAAGKSLVNALGNSGDAPIPVADNATGAGGSSIQATLGRKDDTEITVGTASSLVATFARYLKSLYTRSNPPAADNVIAAGSASQYDAIGQKGDAAVTTAGATATLFGYVKGILLRVANLVLDVTTATHTQTAAGGTGAQIAIENLTAIGQVSAYLDLSNLTQNANVRLQRRIDGTNYRTFREIAWTIGDFAVVEFEGFTTRNGFRVIILSIVAEGADRSVPTEYMVDDRQ